MSQAETSGGGPVRRRIVFYIPGFDPRGPVHYHRLYAEEGAKQASVNGLALQVSKRKTVDQAEALWTVDTATTHTDYRYCRYEDIVRQQWPRNGLAMYGGIARYAWHFLRMGVFAMILRNSWPSFVAVTYPPLLVCGLFLLSALAGIVIAMALAPLLDAASWLAVVLTLALPFFVYRLIDTRLNAFWLARSCTFLVDRSLGKVPGIEDRCSIFARRVADAVNTGTADEVLLASHSVGTHLAISVAAQALALINEDKRFSLLTLGQAIAMTPDEPAARRFRADLLAVSVSDRIDWIDVTSAVDGSCIPLSDPLALSGIRRPEAARIQPKLVSARFNRVFTPETYATIRRDFLRTHFQYLMAAELPGDYDYFLVTAGDTTLQKRFAHLDSVTDFNRFRLGQS